MKALRNRIVLLLLLTGFAGAAVHAASTAKGKYGPDAQPLSIDHEYLKGAKGSDFWALMPFYLPQQDGRSCSVASVAMLVNAVRAARLPGALGSEDELVTQPGILKKTASDVWNKGVGPIGRGVTLDQLGELATQALKAYGFEKVSVEVVHAENTPAALAQLTRALAENEKSNDDFILINFDQGLLTHEATAGHIAPIGAYDAKRKRVLILDPDRQWYEPYWTGVDALLRSMATADPSTDKTRGYLRIRVLRPLSSGAR